jgi:peptide/nickel transport system substrate-binding protein
MFSTVAGKLNGWSQLAFNTYSKPIKGGGASTTALQDVAFRDALGYAIDKQALVDRVLGGFGDPGSTVVPVALADWHVDPLHPRTFDIAVANQKLAAAGYPLDSSGHRLDKDGKQINLRLYYPNSDDNYPKVAQFVKSWYGQLGIGVTTQSFDSGTLGNIILPPEGGGQAKYDIELWGWVGNPDPNALLQIFKCDAVGSSSDSQYCNPTYDQLYSLQLTQSGDARKATLAQMQNLIYADAPYDVLYYDNELDVYRNDRFAGWQDMPSNGTPFFTYGPLDYTLLTDATATPSQTPAAASAAASGSAVAPSGSTSGSTSAATPAPVATPAASGDTGTPASSSSNATLLLVLVLVVVVVVVVGLVLTRRRGSAGADDE